MLLANVDDILTLTDVSLTDANRNEYSKVLAAVSRKIEQFCHRNFEYQEHASEFEYLGEEVLRFPHRPITSISSVQIASSRELLDLDDVTSFRQIDEREVYVKTTFTKGIIVATYYAGYILPTYSGVVAPDAASVGEYWMDYTGMVLKECTVEGDSNPTPPTFAVVADPPPVLPDTIIEAASEYCLWVRDRVKKRALGTKERSRGYGYEGSTMVMERSMPEQIKEMLEEEIQYD